MGTVGGGLVEPPGMVVGRKGVGRTTGMVVERPAKWWLQKINGYVDGFVIPKMYQNLYPLLSNGYDMTLSPSRPGFDSRQGNNVFSALSSSSVAGRWLQEWSEKGRE
jgi:hypothetical protein